MQEKYIPLVSGVEKNFNALHNLILLLFRWRLFKKAIFFGN